MTNQQEYLQRGHALVWRGRIVLASCLTSLTGLTAGVGLAACEPQALYCGVAIGDFAVRVEALDASACLPPVMLFGLEPLPGVGQLRPDYTKTRFAISSQALVDRLEFGEFVGAPGDSDPSHVSYALGAFDHAYPDSADTCRVSNLQPAEIMAPAFEIPDNPETIEPDGLYLPPVDERYVWQNIEIEMSADVQGTRFWGVLNFSDLANDCAGTYAVAGVWPVVSCMVDADCTKTCETIEGVPGHASTESCMRSQLNPDWLESEVGCVGAFADPDPALARPGLCVPRTSARTR
jgi:hypothetical protein